jgi:hypothetical protein
VLAPEKTGRRLTLFSSQVQQAADFQPLLSAHSVVEPHAEAEGPSQQIVGGGVGGNDAAIVLDLAGGIRGGDVLVLSTAP